jgi:hypothetical protein
MLHKTRHSSNAAQTVFPAAEGCIQFTERIQREFKKVEVLRNITNYNLFSRL